MRGSSGCEHGALHTGMLPTASLEAGGLCSKLCSGHEGQLEGTSQEAFQELPRPSERGCALGQARKGGSALLMQLLLSSMPFDFLRVFIFVRGVFCFSRLFLSLDFGGVLLANNFPFLIFLNQFFFFFLNLRTRFSIVGCLLPASLAFKK